MKSFIGYARVSTQEQDLTAQIDSLTAYGCCKVFSAKVSGKANDKSLRELLDYVREGDVVCVTKLDRLGRSLSAILNTISELQSKNIGLITLDGQVNTSDNSPMSKAMVQLLGMFAELEHSIIVDRLQTARKASGKLGGRKPKLTQSQRKEIAKKVSQGISKRSLSIEYGLSRGTILNIEREFSRAEKDTEK